MWNSDELTLAELRAWQQHPNTVARMAEVCEWNRQERLRKWEEAEQEQKRLTRENEERERRQKEELARKREVAKREEAEQQRLLRISRERETRSRYYGLVIRQVNHERKGDHDIWSTGFRSRRMVHGVASTPTITTNNHSRNPAGCKVEFPIPLLCEHENKGRGCYALSIAERDLRYLCFAR
jgi:hypothetical protein